MIPRKSTPELKARNGDSSTETVGHLKRRVDHYALSALGNSIEIVPGPMAQGTTFRAFGAAKLTLDTHSELLSYYHSSAEAD